MKYLRINWRLLCSIAIALGCCPQLHAGRMVLPLNDGWRFHLAGAGTNSISAESPESASPYEDSRWDKVVLPHTPRLEAPESAQDYFQGICWYRRRIKAEPAWRGKKVSLRFEGAMQLAEVWVNNRHVLTHRGGYLPFSVDLTAALAKTGGAVVAVRLDNTDHSEIPPGKRHDQLDFSYFGGLYRDVRLVVTDPLHITDAVAANRVAAGGIFVRTESASAGSAVLFAQADIVNEGASETNVSIHFKAIDPRGETVAEAVLPLPSFAAGAELATNCLLTVKKPRLWHPDHPWLYTLKTEVRRGAKVADSVSTRFGIRTLACDNELGFVLNGSPLTIRGANRHQDFPWLGNAVPDNAAYRDLKRLKDAGFNFLRLAHYPQSPAVMDACDELGLMVSVCTPGWQYFKADTTFTNLAKQDVREMVRWHRNHPSAVMWEVSLNETYGHDRFYAECSRIAHEEYPGSQMLTSGDSYASKDVRHYEVPYAGWEGFYERDAAPGFAGVKRSFAREYGDYEFGGEHSTTRVGRGAGEDALLLQSWNFVWSHNRNSGFPWLLGDCIWVGVDHFRGCSAGNPISRCGVLDYLRLPKFSYYFFQSQRGANVPEVFIANYWTPRSSPAKVVIFSNCEEVELFLNGKSLGRHRPDHGPDSDYGIWHPDADPVYMATGKTVLDDEKNTAADLKAPRDNPLRAMFDGGNCRNVDHPPFTFAPVDYAAGELKAVGYVGGKSVASCVRSTPGQPAKLQLAAELENRPLAADGADAIFVRAAVCDASGNPVPGATNVVQFVVSGEGRLVSASAVPAEAGIATALVRSSALQPGRVIVRATANGLQSAKLAIRSALQEHYEESQD